MNLDGTPDQRKTAHQERWVYRMTGIRLRTPNGLSVALLSPNPNTGRALNRAITDWRDVVGS